MATTDVLIVGGGIAGLSLAAAIGDRARTVVLEAEPRLFHHTSSRSAQQMQPTYGPAPARRLTAASLPLVEAIGRRLGRPILTPRPLLWVLGEDEPAALDALIATVPGLERIGADEALRQLPVLRRARLWDAAVDGAAMEVDVPALLDWYRDTATAGGVTIRTGIRVECAERIGDVWRVEIDGARIEAPVVVDAAGAWADQVAARFGAASRGLVAKRRTVAVARSTARTVDPSWPMAADVADRWYFRPRGDSILACALEDVPSEPEDAQPLPEIVALAIDRVNTATDLALDAPELAWTGLRTLAPDGLPIVGPDHEVPGFWWLAGQGGYGIQTSAALGSLVADALTGTSLAPDGLEGVLAELDPTRFG